MSINNKLISAETILSTNKHGKGVITHINPAMKVTLQHKCLQSSVQARKEGNEIYAKKHLKKSDVYKILCLYSKSIAFAPRGTEDLALGYGNRSALLLRIKEYEACVADIDKSCQISNNDDLKAKLLARKAKCLQDVSLPKAQEDIKGVKSSAENSCETETIKKYLNELNDTSQLKPSAKKQYNKLNIPEFKRSNVISCASESVALNYNKESGKHVVAAKDIKTGEIIAVDDGVIKYTMRYDDSIYMKCSNCLIFSYSNIPCDHCSFAVYCSAECKEKAWTRYHSIECHVLPIMFRDKKCEFDVKMISDVRIFLTALSEGGVRHMLNEAVLVDNNIDVGQKGLSADGKFDCKTFRAMYSLPKGSLLPSAKFINVFLKTLMKHTDLLKDMSVGTPDYLNLKKLFVKIGQINYLNTCHTRGQICFCDSNGLADHGNDCFKRRGGSFTTFSGLLNHSCCGQVQAAFVNKKVVFFALKPIKKDEQLFILRGPTFNEPKQVRQDFRRYYANCQCDCEACLDDWPLPNDVLVNSIVNKLKMDPDIKKQNELFNKCMYDADMKKDTSSKIERFQVISKLIDMYYEKTNNMSASIATFALKVWLILFFTELYEDGL